MSTLGKILLFVNLLLAVGVLYLAAQDYAKRQELNNAAAKYQLVLGGLPVDPIKDASVGEPAADQALVGLTGPNNVTRNVLVSKKLVENLYGGGDVPASQVDLVNAAYAKINREVDAKPSDATRLAELCGFLDAGGTFRPGRLMALADSYEERVALRRLALAPADQAAANLKDARDRLKRRVDSVTVAPDADQPEKTRKVVEDLKAKILAAPNDATLKAQLNALSAGGPTGPTASDMDRRMKIAQLLMASDPAPDWQKKVALTVGLKIYQLAITEQTSRLEAMAASTRDARFSDQQNFDAEYEQLHSFALELSKLVDQQDRVVTGLREALATDELLFNQRTAQLTSLKGELAKLTADVTKQLAVQKKTEQDVFEVQRQVGLTLRETGKLEGDLRAKEAAPK